MNHSKTQNLRAGIYVVELKDGTKTIGEYFEKDRGNPPIWCILGLEEAL